MKYFIIILSLLISIISCNKRSTAQLKEEAISLITDFEYSKSINILEKIKDEEKDNEVYYYLGKCYFNLKNYEISLVNYHHAIGKGYQLDGETCFQLSILYSCLINDQYEMNDEKENLAIAEKYLIEALKFGYWNYNELINNSCLKKLTDSRPTLLNSLERKYDIIKIIPKIIKKTNNLDLFKIHDKVIAHKIVNLNEEKDNELIFLIGDPTTYGIIENSYLLLYISNDDQWMFSDIIYFNSYSPISLADYSNLNKLNFFKLPESGNDLYTHELDSLKGEEIILPAFRLSDSPIYYIISSHNGKLSIVDTIEGIEQIYFADGTTSTLITAVNFPSKYPVFPEHFVNEKKLHQYTIYKFNSDGEINSSSELTEEIYDTIYKTRMNIFSNEKSLESFAKVIVFIHFNSSKKIDDLWYSNTLSSLVISNLTENQKKILMNLNHMILGTPLQIDGQ